MNIKSLLLTAAFIGLTVPAFAQAGAAKELKLYTVDCGTIKILDANIMDTTDSYEGSLELKASCYVIQNGDEYMLWDAGFNPEAIAGSKEGDMFRPSITQTIPESLETIGLKPSDIDKIGISHVHFDHIGQANTFKDAKLYIGTEDFDQIFDPEVDKSMYFPQFIDEWKDGGNVVKITQPTDVFGDGRVTIIPAHGHTPGHTLLKIDLENAGSHILVGDLWHFKDNMKYDRMPDFNYDMAETTKSMAEIKALATDESARLIIQHDPQHFHQMPKLPAYLD